MTEPSNSWEVSYVISIKKPSYDVSMTKEELYHYIKRHRAMELESWAKKKFNYRWFVEHTVRRPPLPKLDEFRSF